MRKENKKIKITKKDRGVKGRKRRERNSNTKKKKKEEEKTVMKIVEEAKRGAH